MRDVYEIRRNRAKQVKKERCQLLIVCAIIVFILGVISVSFLSNAKEIDSVNENYRYESIVIKEGDSLWSIVEDYELNKNSTTKEVIDELIYLNNLSDTVIHAGEHLVICCTK